MPRLPSRLSRIPGDARLVIGLAVVLMALLVLASEDEPAAGEISRGLDGISAAILATAGLALLACKRFPGTTVLVVMALTSLWYQIGHTSPLINPFPLIAFYSLGLTGDRRRQVGIGVPAVAIPFAVAVGVSEPIIEQFGSGDWPIDALGWPLMAMLLGELVRNRRLLVAEYAQRASVAEAEREAEAQRRVTDERLRIARDLHDVLAHTVSTMTVQAGAAADTLDRDPDTARAALASIRTAGKEAMNEVRATVSVLRETDPGGATDTSPVPRLDRIPELVENARRQGLRVELLLERPDIDLDSMVELTAYRIVQEALTNVSRHAHATHVTVHIRHSGGELAIAVTDDGTPQDTTGTGFGIRGMRERIEPLNGTLDYGPRPEGGWAVTAKLPTGK